MPNNLFFVPGFGNSINYRCVALLCVRFAIQLFLPLNPPHKGGDRALAFHFIISNNISSMALSSTSF